jgi:hypothetical protein
MMTIATRSMAAHKMLSPVSSLRGCLLSANPEQNGCC